jgi:hypothetical protein
VVFNNGTADSSFLRCYFGRFLFKSFEVSQAKFQKLAGIQVVILQEEEESTGKSRGKSVIQLLQDSSFDILHFVAQSSASSTRPPLPKNPPKVKINVR